MKSRPILFSAPMVRALLAGTKTQTRRVVKPQPVKSSGTHRGYPLELMANDWAWPHPRTSGATTISNRPNGPLGWEIHCPYGQPGDRLWVRENGWERPERTPKMMREGADTWDRYYFDADGYDDPADREQLRQWGFRRRPSIHMPRWASRLTLEITGVRVERLQAISEADAIAEGVESPAAEREERDWSICPTCGGAGLHLALGQNLGVTEVDCRECDTHAKRYRHLWETINGPGSWDANPWVWVVEFKRANGGEG